MTVQGPDSTAHDTCIRVCMEPPLKSVRMFAQFLNQKLVRKICMKYFHHVQKIRIGIFRSNVLNLSSAKEVYEKILDLREGPWVMQNNHCNDLGVYVRSTGSCSSLDEGTHSHTSSSITTALMRPARLKRGAGGGICRYRMDP